MNVSPKFKTLQELFNYSTNRYSQNRLFSYIDGDYYTYKKFGEVTTELAKLLRENGVAQNEKVAILGQNMPNWPVSFFSLVAFGRVAVPLLPDFSQFEIENIMEHSESKALFVSQRLRYKISDALFEKIPLIIELDTLKILKSTLAPISLEAEKSEVREEDLANIIYTSGTTGSSKGVMLSHRNLSSHLNSASLLRPGFEWDIWLSLLPLSHTLESSLSMMLPMVSGSSVYYMEKAPTPTVLLSALKRVRPTTILSVPMIIEKIYRGSVKPQFTTKRTVKALYETTLGRKLLHRVAGKKLKKTFGGRLRFFGIGGAKLDGEVERFLYEAKFPYAIGYGLTESSPLLAGAIPNMVKWQSTGPAVSGVELKIGNPNPQTGEGEILAKGPNIMVGYYKNEEATAEAFTEDGWFRTKDLGVIDKSGRLYIRGRLSNMILGPSGENIYPEEIESVINGHAMVAESIVTQSKGGKLIAKVHFNPEKLKALKEATEEALADYYQTTKESLVKSYDETKEELTKLFNEKIEQLKKELSDYVNSRVNKFSRISVVVDYPEQFEKTATQKIKRYKYLD